MIYVFAAVTLVLVAAVIAEELLGHGLGWLVQEVPAGHPEFAYLDVDVIELRLVDGWDEADVLTTLAEISSL
jgi:hypothetical protein